MMFALRAAATGAAGRGALRLAHMSSVCGASASAPRSFRLTCCGLAADCALVVRSPVRALTQSDAAHSLHPLPPCRCAQRLRLQACTSGTRCPSRPPRCRPASRCVWVCACAAWGVGRARVTPRSHFGGSSRWFIRRVPSLVSAPLVHAALLAGPLLLHVRIHARCQRRERERRRGHQAERVHSC